ncbi:MAG: pyruvate dehydrogenase (acetyl-transferring) E1 component subunit alpha, partial [Verrucomicrobia bacterium]|nr:pyruvate dehydrogenase (acetyl-transferring) E1 component subunit alpha [Cytophagales bacterium]
AAEHARSGKGPYLLELRTYRYRGHSMSDPQKYRTREEVEGYKKLDPIEQVKIDILKHSIATENDLNLIDEEIKKQVEESVAFAESSAYPPVEEAFKDIYVQQDYPFVME